MFNWMNRRVYFFLKYWLVYVGIVFGIIAGITAHVCILVWADSQWGSKGFFGTLIGLVFLWVTLFSAWFQSADALAREREFNSRVERSLKRDWTK